MAVSSITKPKAEYKMERSRGFFLLLNRFHNNWILARTHTTYYSSEKTKYNYTYEKHAISVSSIFNNFKRNKCRDPAPCHYQPSLRPDTLDFSSSPSFFSLKDATVMDIPQTNNASAAKNIITTSVKPYTGRIDDKFIVKMFRIRITSIISEVIWVLWSWLIASLCFLSSGSM